MNMILVAVWKGSGKRMKRSMFGASHFALYGQKFLRGIKATLTPNFIKEAGLDNKDTYGAVRLSLQTDYGIHIVKESMMSDLPSKTEKKMKSKRKSKAKKKRTVKE
jgi:hypothetical protein